MTVSTTTNKVAYTGNGVARDWNFSFPVLVATDMSVYLTDLTTEVTTLLTANYEVDLLNSLVTYPTVASGLPLLTTNYKITLARELELKQETAYANAGAFPSETIEKSLDNAIMISQQIQEQLDRIDQKDIGTGLKDIEDVKTITFSDATVQTSAGVGTASSVASTDGTQVLDGGTDGSDATFTGDVTGNLTGDVTGDVTGNLTGAINGVTDGSSAAAGEVGEVITYNKTSNVNGSTTLGVYTDAITNCTLEAGSWEITIKGSLSIDGATGAAPAGVIGVLALTDNSDTVILESDVCFASAEVPTNLGSTEITLPPIDIASQTTYKVRFSAIANTGSPTYTALNYYASATRIGYFRAKRLR